MIGIVIADLFPELYEEDLQMSVSVGVKLLLLPLTLAFLTCLFFLVTVVSMDVWTSRELLSVNSVFCQHCGASQLCCTTLNVIDPLLSGLLE